MYLAVFFVLFEFGRKGGEESQKTLFLWVFHSSLIPRTGTDPTGPVQNKKED